WIMFVMLSIALLLATGITNMVLIPKQNDFAEGPSYSMLAGIKFLLAMPVFFIVSTLLGRSANAEKFRQKSALWLNVALVLCLAIVLLGGYLRFVKRTPKTAANRSKTAEIFRPAA
ncbi:MAG: hypothetical protein KDA41_01325, partial [Planctomycetales bacterium]|nr:hypothetical protein [Planctomycetales bacterium]